MEKAWTIDFSCGMVGCDADSFFNEIMPKMSHDELLYILNEIGSIYTDLKDEYIKRYPNG